MVEGTATGARGKEQHAHKTAEKRLMEMVSLLGSLGGGGGSGGPFFLRGERGGLAGPGAVR